MFNPLSFITKLIKTSNQKELERIKKTVSLINNCEPKFIELKDADFPEKTKEFKNRIEKGEKLNDLLPEAFALHYPHWRLFVLQILEPSPSTEVHQE